MTLATGFTLGRAVLFLATPILSRLYRPEDFGVLALFLAIFSPLVAWDFLRVTLIVGSFVLSNHLGFGIGETLMVYAGLTSFVYLVLLVLNTVAIKWKVPRIAAESGESSPYQK